LWNNLIGLPIVFTQDVAKLRLAILKVEKVLENKFSLTVD
jgi:hypothetical protein